jgi:hypothetical protein
MSIHKNYLLLTPEEQCLVNMAIDDMMVNARDTSHFGYVIPLNKSDSAERAVEAVATWVVESRPKNAADIERYGHTAAWNAVDGESSYDPKTPNDLDDLLEQEGF